MMMKTDNMNLTIRPIVKSDYNEYIHMAKDFYSMPCCDHNVDSSHFENAFSFCLTENEYSKLFILECDGIIVGYGNISFTYSIEAGGNVIFLEELYIKQEYRNKGIGKKYFEFIHKNFPAKRYRLEVTRSNEKEIEFYKSLGYNVLDYIQMIKE